jgi:hypothetical protein
VAPNGAVTIDCVPGRYFRSLATGEQLDAELMLAQKGREHTSVALSDLTHRAWLHDQAGGDQVVLDGRNREAAVSVAATLMHATKDGGYRIFLTPRSEDVASHKFFNHVVPAGIFQPLEYAGTPDDQFVTDEFSVRRTFAREYIEELYGRDDFGGRSEKIHQDPEQEPELKRLYTALKSAPGSGLYYTGVSVNLLTLRPEICLLLLITDPSWLASERATAQAREHPMKYGWEIIKTEEDLPPGRSLSRWISLDADFEPRGHEQFQPDLLVPNAAAAVHLAIRVARDITGARRATA